MKKRLGWKVLFAFAIIAVALTLLSFSSTEKKIEKVLSARIQVMDGFYDGKVSYNDAMNELEQIEGGRLLEQDLNNLLDYYQTDISDISDYKIKKVNIKFEDENIVCADVKISYNIVSLGEKKEESSRRTEIMYSVMCQKREDDVCLIQLISL